jgi:hypothetical protein
MIFEPAKETLAELWAEMEAGKITVCFPDGSYDRCILWVENRILLLTRGLDEEEEGITFEYKPSDYKAPTKEDIKRVMMRKAEDEDDTQQ